MMSFLLCRKYEMFSMTGAKQNSLTVSDMDNFSVKLKVDAAGVDND